MHIDPFWLNVIVATIVPMVTALVTSKVASPAVKAIVLGVLAAVGMALAEVVNGNLVWDQFAKTFVVVFLGAVGIHFGLLKPVGLTGSQGAIQSVVPQGIGGPAAPPAP